MTLTEDRIRQALTQVPFPGFSKDIVAAGVVRGVQLQGDRVRLYLAFGTATPEAADSITRACRESLLALEGVSAVEIDTGTAGSGSALNVLPNDPPPARGPARADEGNLVSGVRHVVAVASGKGGVGKSTVAVNLAVALARRGHAVGLLDADIYGPSIPLMMGAVDRQPGIDQQAQRLIPLEQYGVRFMSLGFLVDPEAAVIWRGPMVMKALEQLLQDVDWSGLDYLVIDLPPGTGDAQLTLSQRVRLAGAVIVTTPQDVALADAIKGVAMFRKVGVPVLGLIENMSYFNCPHCAKRTEIFGHGGGRAQATRLEVPFLGEIPLDVAIRTSGDTGMPVTAGDQDLPAREAFLTLADSVTEALRRTEGSSDWAAKTDTGEA